MAQYGKVYIIGFMGSGKTTMGSRLAGLLGWQFADLDKLIEEDAGMSIPDIFSSSGESAFREIESRMLRTLENKSNIVVSTGGGAPCNEPNISFMLETGLVVYLKLTPGQLKSRIAGTGNERPLIKNLTDNELRKFIEDKLAEREKWYSRAQLIFSGFDTDAHELYRAIGTKIQS